MKKLLLLSCLVLSIVSNGQDTTQTESKPEQYITYNENDLINYLGELTDMQVYMYFGKDSIPSYKNCIKEKDLIPLGGVESGVHLKYYLLNSENIVLIDTVKSFGIKYYILNSSINKHVNSITAYDMYNQTTDYIYIDKKTVYVYATKYNRLIKFRYIHEQ